MHAATIEGQPSAIVLGGLKGGSNMHGQRNNTTSDPEVIPFARAAQSGQEDD
jgi:hypothetical protein